MALGAHDEIFCSDLLYSHWSKGIRVRMEMVRKVQADPEKSKTENFAGS